MKYLIKYVSIVLLFLVVKAGFAQNHANVYNIYTQNRFLYNAAHTGDFGQAFLDVKENYMGVTKAQETYTFGINSAIGNSKNSGLGLLVDMDKRNVERRTSVFANYSYGVALNAKNRLAFGLGMGVSDQRIVQGDVMSELPLDYTDYDALNFAARFGINYTWDKKLNVGFALPDLLTTDYSFNKHFLGMASYKFYALREKVEIEPSVLYRHHISESPYAVNQLDFNLYTCWNQTFWLSGAYRLNPTRNAGAFIVGGGLMLYNVGVGYAYESGIGNDLAVISNGTHEIQLTYFFDKDRQKNNNEDLLNNNQLEMMVDSVPTDMQEYYQKKIDSLDQKMKELENLEKIDKFAELADALIEAMKRLDEEKQKVIELKNDGLVVFFDVNKYIVNAEYVEKLDAFADEIKASGQSVEVHGYADEQGPEGYNKTLSEKRAQAVKDDLVRRGVSASKLSIFGHGETTEFGSLDSNRRVEFKVIK